MLIPAEVTVRAMTPSSNNCITIKITDGEIQDNTALQNYYTVFSSPPSKWWKDVRFACSTIQLCTSRDEADGWHERHGFYRGDVVGLETLWKLSKVWYGDKHAYNYQRKTPEEVEKIFQDLGLVSKYWSS